MIQRLQTILLFLASALCVAFLFFPTWMVVNPDNGEGGSKTITAYPMKVVVESSEMSLTNAFSTNALPLTENTFVLIQFIAVIAIAILLLVTIFMFNNRDLQVKMAYGAMFLFMGMFVMLVPIRTWLQEMGGDPTIAGELYQSVPQWGLGAPLTAMLLTWWAIKRIQKDEKLVQGMNRLR
ncbi:MAG: DUF4293 domain-containing protein [Bacteroidetes bacterium]|nr:DUF4293 domain-containing protein [Bacteroidota bacterium]MBP6722067.1 DUF4293 domain-containing protein [Bacteroidia bacterium]